MFEKLNEMMNRYEELNEEMVQPEVAGNFEKYQACLKERNALQPVVRKYQEYLSVTRQLEDARELLSENIRNIFLLRVSWKMPANCFRIRL